MDSVTPSCAKCGTGMSAGLSTYRVKGLYYPVFWVEGESGHSSQYGVSGRNLDVSGRAQAEVTTYRCPDCGYLESYAARAFNS